MGKEGSGDVEPASESRSGRREARQIDKQTNEDREKEREMGGRQGPFKREHSECAQEVLLVATAEDVSCQDPKSRPVQMPEY